MRASLLFLGRQSPATYRRDTFYFCASKRRNENRREREGKSRRLYVTSALIGSIAVPAITFKSKISMSNHIF
jgi:hypothetical protein